MYHYLRGILVKKELDRVIVECGGIGYEVMTSRNSSAEYEENSEIRIYTKMIIKNSALDHYLFGPGGDDYSAWSLRDIERRLKQEIAKTYGG